MISLQGGKSEVAPTRHRALPVTKDRVGGVRLQATSLPVCVCV